MICSTQVLAAPDKGVIPDTLELNQRWNYNNYTHLVLPTIEWLQNTPIDTNNTLRTRHNNFLMYWLQKNEDVIVHMPEYLLEFQNASRELYFIYTGGWIQHAFKTKDTSRQSCGLAAVKAVLSYYEGKNGIPENDYLNCLLMIRNKGKLNNLFDSSDNAENTYIFLKPPADKHEFAPDENYFTFHYTGINFTNTRALKYRYKLEGYYDKWINTEEQTVTFPNLPHGKYKFRVQASIHQDFAHAVEDEYSFTIATPFYLQSWFMILVTLLIVSILIGYTRWREKQLKKIAGLQHEKVLFEYEYLKSQVNPHFLFNSLNTLTSLIDSDQKAAVNYTEHLSDLYRKMLAHPDKNLVTLQEELNILKNYIYIQQSRFGDALVINDQIPTTTKQEKKVLYLAVQLLVENAIKHNVVSQSSPLTISLYIDNNELVVTNPIQNKMSTHSGNGMGLENIAKRYALFTKRPISFGEKNGNFVVTLPLL